MPFIFSCGSKEVIEVKDFTFKSSISVIDTTLIAEQSSKFLLEISEYLNPENLYLSYRINNSTSEKIQISGSEIQPDNYQLKDNKIEFSFNPRSSGTYSLDFTIKNSEYSQTLTLSLDIRKSTSFVITLLSGTGGKVTPSGKLTAKLNEVVEIYATPEKYFTFDRWSDGILEAKRKITIKSDTTLTAYFKDSGDENFKPELILATPNNNFDTERTITLELNGYTRDKILMSYRINEKTEETLLRNGVPVEFDNVELKTLVDKKFTFTYKPNRVEKKTLTVFLLVDEYKKTLNLEIPLEASAQILFKTDNPDNGNVSHSGGVYDYHKTVECTATPAPGKKFLGWYKNDELVSENSTISVTVGLKNEIYTAKFIRVVYVVSTKATPADGGVITGSGNYSYNDNISVTATANKGFIFSNFVIGTRNITSNPYKATITSDLSIEGIFKKIQKTITFSAGTGGSVSSKGGVYDYGTVVKSLASPAKDMRFIGWYKNNVFYSSAPELSITVGLEDLSLEARFESNLRQIILNNENSTLGTITGGGIFTFGSEVKITASPITHYHLAGWYENNVLTTTDNPSIFTLDKDRQFTAKWARNEHTITTISGKGYSITPSQKVFGGESATISLSIDKDYKFVNYMNPSFSWDKQGTIKLNNVSQDYTIQPNVRYNIISIYLSYKDEKITIFSSITAPSDIRISLIYNLGPTEFTILKGTSEVQTGLEYIAGLPYSIEYAYMISNDGYEIKY